MKRLFSVRGILVIATVFTFFRFVALIFSSDPTHRPSADLAKLQQQRIEQFSDDASDPISLLVETSVGTMRAAVRDQQKRTLELRAVEAAYAEALERHLKQANVPQNVLSLHEAPSSRSRRHLAVFTEEDEAEIKSEVRAASLSPQFGYLERFELLEGLDGLLSNPISKEDISLFAGPSGEAWAQRTRMASQAIVRQTNTLEKHLDIAAIDQQYGVILELWKDNFDRANGRHLPRKMHSDDAAFHPSHEEGLRRWKQSEYSAQLN